MIKQLQKLGFTLGEIRLLFDLFGGGARECDDSLDAIESKIDDIESELGRLGGIKTTLVKTLSRCEKGGPLEACAMLDKLKRSEFLE
jgi:DNA-binding transcriptional MerR regulator